MSFVSKILGIITPKQNKVVVKTVVPYVVKTSDLISNSSNEGVARFKGINIVSLLRSPEADKFIASSKQQNATIINDVIMPMFKETSEPVRVITKRLNTGTTVSTIYSLEYGELLGKEVLSKNSASVTNYTNGEVRRATIRTKNGKYLTVYNGHLLDSNKTRPTRINFDSINGVTQRANSKNDEYQKFLLEGKVYESCL